jgi:hypothetical protein
MLEWLENWYCSQCDGGWEHSYGIKIESIDNPGWSIKIDLDENIEKIEFKEIPWILIEESEDKWIGYKIENNKFKGSGSPKNLNIIIYAFKELIEKGFVNEDEIRNNIK